MIRRLLPKAVRARLGSTRAAIGRATKLAEEGRNVPAFQIYASAARRGDAEAQFRVGCCYLEGKGVPVSRVEAIRWLERAALQRHLDAKLFLATLMLQGFGASPESAVATGRPAAGLFHPDAMPRDFTAAAKWARHAALRGSPEGQAIFAYILSNGPDSLRNQEEAHLWYERAAAGGSANGKFGYALSLAQRSSSPVDREKIAELVRGAAEAGHVVAARTLGQLYLNGDGVVRNPDEAARWLSISAAGGDRQAQANLANLLLAGAGTPESLATARRWFTDAAIAGDPVAQYNFGICLAEGIGGEQDEVRALRWLRDAADRVVNAQYCYGRMLAAGRGAEANPQEGRSWIARAASSGMSEAEFALAEMMVNGAGGPRDHAGAETLLERAADKGHVGAMFALAALKGGGYEVPADSHAALHWLREAAGRGHSEAQQILAASGNDVARRHAAPIHQ
jgi:uncharacterized protein